MANRSYSNSFRAEAVALGRVLGAEAASAQLGIGGKDTLRRWMAQAGDGPEMAVPPSQWQSLMDTALARAQSLVATGKLTAIQLSTVAAIAQRNRDKADKAGAESAVQALAAFDDWLDEVVAQAMPEDATDEILEAHVDALDHVLPWLIYQANREPGQPHRPAILAWFSGKPETEAGGTLEWAKAEMTAVLAEHGDILTFAAHREAEWQREKLIRARALVLSQSGMRAHEALAFAAQITP